MVIVRVPVHLRWVKGAIKRPQVERNPRGEKLVQYINYNLNLKLSGLIGSVILIT
jgi:hypothetical protein